MLTEFQKRFIAEALVSPNSLSDAVIRAGYRGKNAQARAWQLSTKPEIAEALATAQKKIIDKLEISAERVLREIALLGFSNMDDYLDTVGDKRVLNTTKATREQMAAVQEISEDTTGGTGDGERKVVMRTKFKLVDKTKNLELLGRHLRLFTDRVEHVGLESLVTALSEKES